MAKLTCATCFRSQLVDAGTTVDGIGIGAWWTDLRYHSCSECYAHTCWQPVENTACFLDKGHPGRCLPWKDSYGTVLDGVEPMVGLWT